VAAVLAPLLILAALLRVPETTAAVRPRATPQRESLRALWLAFAGNPPLLRLLGAFLPVAVLLNMSIGTQYLFLDAYLGLGKYLAAAALIAFPASVIAAPFWGWMSLRFERHRVLSVAFLIGAAMFAAFGFVPRGDAALVPVLVLWPAAVFCIAGGIQVIAPALLGDVADYGRLETGTDRSGIYAASLQFVVKSLGGVATGLGLAIASWVGFDAAASEQTATAAFGIRLVSAWLPACGIAAAAWLLWRFPIDRARQGAIRQALDARPA
jgi:Na+/melibiose symporter-like transporter